MKVVFILLLGLLGTFLNASNAPVECSYAGGGHSGYLRYGEMGCDMTEIPAGYTGIISYYSPFDDSGHPEVKVTYAGPLIYTDGMYHLPGGYSLYSSINFYGNNFYNSVSQQSTNVNFAVDGYCTKNTTLVLGFTRNNLVDEYADYSWNITLVPNPICSKRHSNNDTLEKLIIDKKYGKYEKSGTLSKGEFKKYKLVGYHSGEVKILLYDLTNDLDLYVKHNGTISTNNWDCRPWYGGKSIEECTINFKNDGSLYTVGVRGYKAGKYKLKVFYNVIDDIQVGSSDSDSVGSKQWHYYKVKGHKAKQELVAKLINLSDDIDLYVKKGSKPTTSSYDCRPWYGGTKDESCTMHVNSDYDKFYIGVYGYHSGSYKLSIEKIKKQATILLHGLNSDYTTWDKLVKEKFHNKCAVIGKNSISNIVAFDSSNNYCFKLNFGKYDRNSGLKDLLGQPCLDRNRGCKGDYSTFDTLGQEVEDAVNKVIQKLGADTDITLVGHSRGGLAAVAYLGGRYDNKYKVKALLTTGTPFGGSPLGKIYGYLKSKCLPYSSKKSSGECKKDWEARGFLKDIANFDLATPSVGFLTPNSSAYKKIYEPDRIQKLTAISAGSSSFYNRYFHNLKYSGIKLGDLVRFGEFAYNPFPSIPSTISSLPYVNGKQFSHSAEDYVLGTWLEPIDMSLLPKNLGDGIVPADSQDMISISSRGMIAIDGAREKSGSIKFNSSNRKYNIFNTNTVHIGEPKRVGDISTVLDKIWKMQRDNNIPKCKGADIYVDPYSGSSFRPGQVPEFSSYPF